MTDRLVSSSGVAFGTCSVPLSSETQYVIGLIHISHLIHPCAVAMGKIAPETIHMGNSTRFMMA